MTMWLSNGLVSLVVYLFTCDFLNGLSCITQEAQVIKIQKPFLYLVG